MDSEFPLQYKEAMENLDADLLNDTGTERQHLMELAGQHAIRTQSILKILEEEDREALIPLFAEIICEASDHPILEEEDEYDEILDRVKSVVTDLLLTIDAHNEYGPVFQLARTEELGIDTEHHTTDQIILANNVRNKLRELSAIFDISPPRMEGLDNRSLH